MQRKPSAASKAGTAKTSPPSRRKASAKKGAGIAAAETGAGADEAVQAEDATTGSADATAAAASASRPASRTEGLDTVPSKDRPARMSDGRADPKHWTRQLCRMPQKEYVLLDALKQRSGRNGGKLKRGEVLRLGLAALAEMSDAEFRELALRTDLPRRGGA